MAVSLNDLMTPLNPVIAGILRSPLHWPLSIGLLLITWTGRRSGRRFTIPVGYQVHGDELTILISKAREKTWWRNFHESAPVELLLRGRRRTGRATLVPPGSEDFARRCDRSLQRMPWLGGQFGIRYDRRTGLTPEQTAHLAEEIRAVVVRLAPA